MAFKDKETPAESGVGDEQEPVAKKKKGKPGSKAHRAAFVGKAIAKAHKAYADRYGDTQNVNPFNSQKV